MVAMAGINPMRFLATEDIDERSLFQAIAQVAFDLRKKEREELAVLIANKMSGK